MNARLAQLVEHLTLNQGVQGSNPWSRTKGRRLSIKAGFRLFSLSKEPKSEKYIYPEYEFTHNEGYMYFLIYGECHDRGNALRCRG